MEQVQHAITWFEIPVRDFERARAFYSAIFDFDMPVNPMGSNMMGFFLHERGSVGGAIVQGEGYEPSSRGAKVYLNAGKDLSVVLGRVEGAGGKVLVPKTHITPEIGYFAVLEDPEGNHVALHSMA